MLQAGVKAPDFTLKDKDGNEVTLSSFQGKKVVLYFYPKDNSPGCTKQACAFAGAYRISTINQHINKEIQQFLQLDFNYFMYGKSE